MSLIKKKTSIAAGCKYFIVLLTALLLTGCAHTSHDGPPPFSFNADNIPNPTPRALAKSHTGNPPSYMALGKRYYVAHSANGYLKRGVASWYGAKFHGRRTSSGEPYNMFKLTAASRTLPIPTFARVTNLENGRSIIVKVNDRGPFKKNRLIDLSYAAAKKLHFAHKGTAPVEVRTITFNPTLSGPGGKTQHTYYQVAVFSHRKNAISLQALLNKLTTLPVAISQVHRQQQALYRVSIGPLVTQAQSVKLRRVMVQLGLGKPIETTI